MTGMARAAVLGAALIGVGAIGAARAATIETIYSFTGAADGSIPNTALVPGPDGALYGADGTVVYQLKHGTNNKWSVTPIYQTLDGPATALAGHGDALFVALGAHYGKKCAQDDYGCGTIVELMPPAKGKTAWAATTIYDFKGGKDGFAPVGMVWGANGALYGATSNGGGSSFCGTDNNIAVGCGTLFKLENVKGKWAEIVLHRFAGGKDGAEPFTAPALDPAGHVFGTTDQGGATPPAAARAAADPSCLGLGVIFGIFAVFSGEQSSLINYKILYDADCGEPSQYVRFLDSIPFLIESGTGPGTPASAPASPVAMIATGIGGGNANDCADFGNGGCGVVFKLTKPAGGKTPWTYESLHKFSGTDGAMPSGFLLPVGTGAIYGFAGDGPVTAACEKIYDSAYGCGVIYKLTQGKAGWAWGGDVYHFLGGGHGAGPVAGLTSYQGMILGVTANGGKGCGDQGCGTIFVFKP